MNPPDLPPEPGPADTGTMGAVPLGSTGDDVVMRGQVCRRCGCVIDPLTGETITPDPWLDIPCTCHVWGGQ